MASDEGRVASERKAAAFLSGIVVRLFVKCCGIADPSPQNRAHQIERR